MQVTAGLTHWLSGKKETLRNRHLFRNKKVNRLKRLRCTNSPTSSIHRRRSPMYHDSSIRRIMETLAVLASNHGSSTRHFFGCCEGGHRKESQRYIGEDRPTKRRSGRLGQWARPSGLDEGRLLQDPATCLLSQLSNATQINQVQRKN